jgi:hypothetical protein
MPGNGEAQMPSHCAVSTGLLVISEFSVDYLMHFFQDLWCCLEGRGREKWV